MQWRDEIVNSLLFGNGRLPFGFVYGGLPSNDFLDSCDRSFTRFGFNGGIQYVVDWVSADGLVVTAKAKLFDGYPAVEFGLGFKNTGNENTQIIERVYSTDMMLGGTLRGGSYLLHYANGAPSSPDDFLMHNMTLNQGDIFSFGGKGGRSSDEYLPFFRIDASRGNALFGIGWSGQWNCTINIEQEGLHFTYGLEYSHFRLYPGESVEMPSLTALFWEGEEDECHSAFRRLVFDHYVPRLHGSGAEPYLFCNTCFTRYGHWLNECNEENQISLIRALKPFQVECVIVDAGWFVGGWPTGAGNWRADPEKYPNGMGALAAAAFENGMKFGLWFELERVAKGTEISLEHPEWLLSDNQSADTFLLNMGLPEARDYALGIVEQYLGIPHFTAYRQDFNVNPLSYWQFNDAPDRAGITELHYINGLYSFLDAIRLNHPDCFMDGCSSGGRRIDLRMVSYFHTNQKTDYWFDSRVDQNSLFSLSHYLPSVCYTAHLNRYDDYSGDSCMASTLCLGWLADAEDFPANRASRLIQRYLDVKPLLNDKFYPLTPFDAGNSGALVSQYHNSEHDAGAVFFFLRGDFELWSDIPKIRLHGLIPDAEYEVRRLNDGLSFTATGASLMTEFPVSVLSLHGYSAVYRYSNSTTRRI